MAGPPSSGSIKAHSSSMVRLEPILSWVKDAPLGTPVVPPVYKIRARSSTGSMVRVGGEGGVFKISRKGIC